MYFYLYVNCLWIENPNMPQWLNLVKLAFFSHINYCFIIAVITYDVLGLFASVCLHALSSIDGKGWPVYFFYIIMSKMHWRNQFLGVWVPLPMWSPSAGFFILNTFLQSLCDSLQVFINVMLRMETRITHMMGRYSTSV